MSGYSISTHEHHYKITVDHCLKDAEYIDTLDSRPHRLELARRLMLAHNKYVVMLEKEYGNW